MSILGFHARRNAEEKKKTTQLTAALHMRQPSKVNEVNMAEVTRLTKYGVLNAGHIEHDTPQI